MRTQNSSKNIAVILEGVLTRIRAGEFVENIMPLESLDFIIKRYLGSRLYQLEYKKAFEDLARVLTGNAKLKKEAVDNLQILNPTHQKAILDFLEQTRAPLPIRAEGKIEQAVVPSQLLPMLLDEATKRAMSITKDRLAVESRVKKYIRQLEKKHREGFYNLYIRGASTVLGLPALPALVEPPENVNRVFEAINSLCNRCTTFDDFEDALKLGYLALRKQSDRFPQKAYEDSAAVVEAFMKDHDEQIKNLWVIKQRNLGFTQHQIALHNAYVNRCNITAISIASLPLTQRYLPQDVVALANNIAQEVDRHRGQFDTDLTGTIKTVVQSATASVKEATWLVGENTTITNQVLESLRKYPQIAIAPSVFEYSSVFPLQARSVSNPIRNQIKKVDFRSQALDHLTQNILTSTMETIGTWYDSDLTIPEKLSLTPGAVAQDKIETFLRNYQTSDGVLLENYILGQAANQGIALESGWQNTFFTQLTQDLYASFYNHALALNPELSVNLALSNWLADELEKHGARPDAVGDYFTKQHSSFASMANNFSSQLSADPGVVQSLVEGPSKKQVQNTKEALDNIPFVLDEEKTKGLYSKIAGAVSLPNRPAYTLEEAAYCAFTKPLPLTQTVNRQVLLNFVRAVFGLFIPPSLLENEAFADFLVEKMFYERGVDIVVSPQKDLELLIILGEDIDEYLRLGVFTNPERIKSYSVFAKMLRLALGHPVSISDYEVDQTIINNIYQLTNSLGLNIRAGSFDTLEIPTEAREAFKNELLISASVVNAYQGKQVASVLLKHAPIMPEREVQKVGVDTIIGSRAVDISTILEGRIIKQSRTLSLQALPLNMALSKTSTTLGGYIIKKAVPVPQPVPQLNNVAGFLGFLFRGGISLPPLSQFTHFANNFTQAFLAYNRLGIIAGPVIPFPKQVLEAPTFLAALQKIASIFINNLGRSLSGFALGSLNRALRFFQPFGNVINRFLTNVGGLSGTILSLFRGIVSFFSQSILGQTLKSIGGFVRATWLKLAPSTQAGVLVGSFTLLFSGFESVFAGRGFIPSPSLTLLSGVATKLLFGSAEKEGGFGLTKGLGNLLTRGGRFLTTRIFTGIFGSSLVSVGGLALMGIIALPFALALIDFSLNEQVVKNYPFVPEGKLVSKTGTAQKLKVEKGFVYKGQENRDTPFPNSVLPQPGESEDLIYKVKITALQDAEEIKLTDRVQKLTGAGWQTVASFSFDLEPMKKGEVKDEKNDNQLAYSIKVDSSYKDTRLRNLVTVSAKDAKNDFDTKDIVFGTPPESEDITYAKKIVEALIKCVHNGESNIIDKSNLTDSALECIKNKYNITQTSIEKIKHSTKEVSPYVLQCVGLAQAIYPDLDAPPDNYAASYSSCESGCGNYQFFPAPGGSPKLKNAKEGDFLIFGSGYGGVGSGSIAFITRIDPAGVGVFYTAHANTTGGGDVTAENCGSVCSNPDSCKCEPSRFKFLSDNQYIIGYLRKVR